MKWGEGGVKQSWPNQGEELRFSEQFKDVLYVIEDALDDFVANFGINTIQFAGFIVQGGLPDTRSSPSVVDDWYEIQT